MKTTLRFFSILIIGLMSVVLYSCGDDSSDGGDNALVGSWTCSDHYYAGTDTFTFKKNGTYSWTYNGSWEFKDESGHYTFDGSLLTLAKKSGTPVIYIVLSLSKSYMVLMDEDGDRYTYYRE